MLGGHGDQVVSPAALPPGRPFERQVVALGGAAGEDELLVAGADGGSQRPAGLLGGITGLPAVGMTHAPRVAKLLGEVRQHRLDHARIDGRGSVMIEVNHGSERWQKVMQAGISPLHSYTKRVAGVTRLDPFAHPWYFTPPVRLQGSAHTWCLLTHMTVRISR
jgi:hypothetical protein